MKCPSCGYENDAAATACNLCTAMLKREVPPSRPEEFPRTPETSTPEEPHPVERPRELVEEMRDERERREQHFKANRRIRLRNHAIAGAAIFFILSCLFGLPESLYPGQLARNLGLSVLFGMPIGFTISYMGGGVWRGALISGSTFACLSILLAFLGEGKLLFDIPWIVASFALGAIPGIIIAYHVDLDE